MKQGKIALPDELAAFINKTKINDVTEFKRAAFMLYAYIDSGLVTIEKTAKLLGVNKRRLIQFYWSYRLSVTGSNGEK